ncbi:MAG: hypothetical protein J7497_04260 [Chitinophagaceae bacterium]|nr:hypothetical protein [Chitinophagaceae bacterium]
MSAVVTSFTRIESTPYERDVDVGFSATLEDPLWFLGRQWQMGEHQGENASSPVWVDYSLASTPIKSYDEKFDPGKMPAEKIVESEIGDWWTMGRRIRIGKLFIGHPSITGKEKFHFHNPPPPYEFFEAFPDGLAIWNKRHELGIEDNEFGDAPPPEIIPSWERSELLYQQTPENSFSTVGKILQVNRHRGGRLDWYSVDAEESGDEGEELLDMRNAIPGPLHYPGAPCSRWWEIEEYGVDSGAYVPDSSHTATSILTELIFSHSDDWFLFPVNGIAGNKISIKSLEVTDSFGRAYNRSDRVEDGTAKWPGLLAPKDWTLFQVDGLEAGELLLWQVAELPLQSLPLERVQFGIDVTNNLYWAVELMIDGRDVNSRVKEEQTDTGELFDPFPPDGETFKPGQIFAYLPAQGIAHYWHPYTYPEEGDKHYLKQMRLPDFSHRIPVPMPKVQAEVLKTEDGEHPHQIQPLAVPQNGIEIRRQWMLARDMFGEPLLWIKRQRTPLLAAPGRRLRFDVMIQTKT